MASFYVCTASGPDIYGYLDAWSWKLYQHGKEEPILPILTEDKKAPVGHPLWCIEKGYHFGRKKIEIDYYEYLGLEYYPITKSYWDSVYDFGPTTPQAYWHLQLPFSTAYRILKKTVVTPTDWDIFPNTPHIEDIKRNIAELYAGYNKNLTEGEDYLRYDALRQMYPTRFTQEETPSIWPNKPYGLSNNDILIKNYPDPYDCKKDIISFNKWNPKIAILRLFRLLIESGIKNLTNLFLRPELRKFVECYPTTHYLYHYFFRHCHIFRYIQINEPFAGQGFHCDCHHFIKEYPARIEIKDTKTYNSLLTQEEEDFLEATSLVLREFGLREVAKHIDKVRLLTPFMPTDALALLEHGYLTPFCALDDKKTPFPFNWWHQEMMY
jgi:hypothetical protein